MLALPLSLVLFSGGGGALDDAAWSFPPALFEVGARVPDWPLPRIRGHGPVSLHSLFGGRPTLIHVFASW